MGSLVMLLPTVVMRAGGVLMPMRSVKIKTGVVRVQSGESVRRKERGSE